MSRHGALGVYGMVMNTEKKNATGELLAVAGAALLFLCAFPAASLLVVSIMSHPHTPDFFFSFFLQMPEMLLWWIGLLASVTCFQVRRAVLRDRKS